MSPLRSNLADPYEIVLLADYPEAVPVIAAGYEAQWDFWYGSGGKGNAKSDLLERSQKCALPLCLVAKRAEWFIGAIAIAANAITPRPNLNPCLVGLWVAPAHRKCGIGTALLNAAITKTAELGFERVYSTTTVIPALFARTGWTLIGKIPFKGEEHWLYAFDSELKCSNQIVAGVNRAGE